MFARKHYKAIAEIIKQAKPSFNSTRMNMGETWCCMRIARDLTDYFAKDNPRFDRDKFLSACGVK